MSQTDAKHFLDDAVRAIIAHHPIPYDPVNPVPKLEPVEFAKKYGKLPDGDYPTDSETAIQYFAQLPEEAKREMLLWYTSDLYEALEEDVDAQMGHRTEPLAPEISMCVGWIVTTLEYAMGMGQTFRDVREFYGRAPLHGCAPINTPARRFPDTSQAEPLSHYPIGATSMRAALAQGGLYAEERAQARDPSPALDRAIREGGAAVVAFPAASSPSPVFSETQAASLSLSDGRFLRTQREALEALTPAVRRQLGTQGSVPHR